MTQTAKLGITRLQERGLTLGLNEFAGYVGALILTHLWVRETLPWARAQAARHAAGIKASAARALGTPSTSAATPVPGMCPRS